MVIIQTPALFFFILLFAYYPVARIIVWVWQGFIKEGTLDVKHQNDIVKYENELLSLQKQIEDKDKNIALLKRDLEIEGNRTCYLKITTEQLIQVLAIRNRRMKDLESHFYLKRMLDAQKRDSYIHLSPEDWFNFFHAVGFENEWKALIDFKRVSEGIANDKK